MNDETGRRNYTKYNKYITLMKVRDEDGDPKLMKSGEMTPHQVASLSFLNDFHKSAGSSAANGNILALNGLQDDVTLEPLGAGKSSINFNNSGEGGQQSQLSSEELMRLPFLMMPAMMNAAIAQQQKEQHQDEQSPPVTMITPSVTISPVKRTTNVSGTGNAKGNDDITVEIVQENNENKTLYKCRKCSFRHANRDAVLAHVKIHFQDYPIVTATPTAALKSQGGSQNSDANMLMNSAMFAAMCLSQQKGGSATNASDGMLPSGLLQQAIQGNSANNALSNLALVLSGGKKHSEGAALAASTILEHGEQNAASQNEASSSMSATSSNGTTASSAQASIGGGGTSSLRLQQPSLQELLTSPRGKQPPPYNTHATHGHGHVASKNKNPIILNGKFNSNYLNKDKHNTVMGPHEEAAQACNNNKSNSSSPNATMTQATGAAAAKTTVTTTTFPAAQSSSNTTTSSSSSSSSNNINNHVQQTGSMASVGASTFLHNRRSSKHSGVGVGVSSGGVHDSNNYTSNNTTTKDSNASVTITINSNNSTSTTCKNALRLDASQCKSNGSTKFASNLFDNNSHFVAHDSNERAEPSPYRCGHCHQVSNWKHVIQRHCRLKHAGAVLIETLDRNSISESSNSVPLYRTISNNNANDSAFNNLQMNLKTTAQNPPNTPEYAHQRSSSNNRKHAQNPKSVVDHLLKSPLAGVAANSTPQDLHATAAAILAAAYKASEGNSPQMPSQATAAIPKAESLLLQQHLQQQGEVEITRLSGAQEASATLTLAQMLDNSTQTSTSNNSKSKKQKCNICNKILESKSQLNYHMSLHKPTQHECHLCDFVCAKKQHLSSHMRQVHQLLHQAPQTSNAMLDAGDNSLSMDFSMALQLAAVAQAQQQQQQGNYAMDLSALKTMQKPTADIGPPSHLVLGKVVSYCPKCPARYPQTSHENLQQGNLELLEHLKAHDPVPAKEQQLRHKCDCCDFAAAQEDSVQGHRMVHMPAYVEGCQKLMQHFLEDTNYPAPKLKRITLKTPKPELMWVVEGEHNRQHSNITSSSTCSQALLAACYDNSNSLLKKQLESGNTALVNIKSQEAQSSPAPSTAPASTNASVATSDLAADVGSSDAGSLPSPPVATPLEKCLHCPYETNNSKAFKEHLQQHVCVSGKKLAFSCDHCDYAEEEQSLIEAHTRLHFNALEKLKSVAFFTSYDGLELSVEETAEDAEVAQHMQKEEEQHEEQQEEPNNNNEENAVNENIMSLKKEQDQQQHKSPIKEENKKSEEKNEAATAETSATVNKIILYKSDVDLKNDEAEKKSEKAKPNKAVDEDAAEAEAKPEEAAKEETIRLRKSTRSATVEAAKSTTTTAAATKTETKESAVMKLVHHKTGQMLEEN